MTETTEKNLKERFKERVVSMAKAVASWYKANFFQTGTALYSVSLVIAAVMFSLKFSDTYWPTAVGYTASFAVLLGVLLAATQGISALCRKIFKRSFRPIMAVIMTAASVYVFIYSGAGEGHTFKIAAVTAAAVCAILLLVSSFWKTVRYRRISVTTVISLLVSLTAASLFGWLIFSEGFDSGMISRYTELNKMPDAAVSAFESTLTDGQYEVAAVDYGTESGFESHSITLMPYMSREDAGWNGKYSEYYLGYSVMSVPLRGRVWYPVGGENCPVLFIAHGNHKIAEPSYEGYEYLGAYLASHGYVVVSVDQNACNMLSGENDARAVLLLKNIGQVLEYNNDSENPLFGVIDEENIAVAGHSRGGEIAATAYLFNGYDRYPENGTIKFNFGYNIKSVIAIAPTVDQYKPADHSVEIEDVNYLLLHGMQDADVKKIMGMTQYENVTFTGERDCIKSALYIGGANHGQFNTLWGEYDKVLPQGALLNTADLISVEDQQKIASVFIKTFLDVTLKGDSTCKSLLTDWYRYSAQLPDTVYAQCWQTSDFEPIANFEEDSDLETATADKVEISTVGVNVWTEEVTGFNGGSTDDTHAMRLKWGRQGSVTFSMPKEDVAGYELTFDIADIYDEAVREGDIKLLDGWVTLVDAERNTAEVKISDFATVYPTFPVMTDKLDHVFNTADYRHIYTTVNIPVSEFESGAMFDASEVIQVKISFHGAGEVIIDNVGWNK